MKGSVIALDRLGGRAAAAHLVDGRLEDFLLDPPEGGPPRPGAIFRAVCARPLKGQGAMLMRLPQGQGYLRGTKGLREGQALLVQVTGYAEPGKAVPLTARLLFKSRFAIVTPDAPGINISRGIRDEDERARLLEIAAEAMAGAPAEAGLILRSACAGAEGVAIAADIAAMADIAAKVLGDAEGNDPELLLDGPDAHMLAWREWPAPDLLAEGEGSFADHGIHEMLDALAGPQVLPGGGFAFVEPTRALVAVDVNTGADTSPAAALKANLALARDLPRLLRCRGLGGQIAVDFAPLAKRDRRQIEQALKAALRRDPVETALAGWTPLGHLELQRKRERLPVLESLMP